MILKSTRIGFLKELRLKYSTEDILRRSDEDFWEVDAEGLDGRWADEDLRRSADEYFWPRECDNDDFISPLSSLWPLLRRSPLDISGSSSSLLFKSTSIGFLLELLRSDEDFWEDDAEGHVLVASKSWNQPKYLSY